MQNKTVYIIGHRNPDTDSCVSAAAYARLKSLLGDANCVAARAGHFSPQTEYVFNRFKTPYPLYIPDMIPKVAHYMTETRQTVDEDESVWDAIGKMEKSGVKALPVVDKNGKYMALLHYSVFAQNILSTLNPERKTSFPTNIALIIRTLNAQPIIVKNESAVFKACVLVGAAEVATYKRTLESRKSENIVAISSDRSEIQEAAIDAGVRLLIITSGYTFKKELREKAEARGVSVVISPYGTSSTSMLIAYSTPVSVMADIDITPVHPEDTVAKIRPLLQESPARCLPVVDGEKKIAGIISEHDLLREPNVELILVDHNEESQAVEGIEHFRIREIIDHHRLGSVTTKYPITFINKPIGSTATIIAGLYRENRVAIPSDVAGLLLCAILSDTLILQSTTTTDVDREMARYLSDITNLDIQTLGREVIAAGSRIKGRSASDLIHQDMKEYTQGKAVYTVSQIEVDGAKEILDRKKEFLDELESERKSRKAAFAALMVTDITALSSVLLFSSDKRCEQAFAFPRMEDGAYYLKDVVSRKKQLIPLLTEQLSRALDE